MNTLVPDTLTGAILLSIIDFFLSFVVISFIGIVLALLPLLNQLGPGIAAKIQQQTAPDSAREAVDMTTDDHVTVISGAIAAIVGAHRIVHIEPVNPGGAWLGEVRTAHHSSHQVEHRGSRAAR